MDIEIKNLKEVIASLREDVKVMGNVIENQEKQIEDQRKEIKRLYNDVTADTPF